MGAVPLGPAPTLLFAREVRAIQLAALGVAGHEPAGDFLGHLHLDAHCLRREIGGLLDCHEARALAAPRTSHVGKAPENVGGEALGARPGILRHGRGATDDRVELPRAGRSAR